MAKKPTKSKPKPKTANRAMRALKPGQVVEIAGLYQSDKSKMRMTLTKGEQAPTTPLKDERWLKMIEMGKPKA